MKEQRKKREFIGLVDKFPQLSANSGLHTPEIKVTIAVVEINPKTGSRSPRNWSHDYEEPKDSTGGCYARVFASDQGVLFGWYGPEISYGTPAQYKHGAAAMTIIDKRMEKMSNVRGYTDDAAVTFGRWLEAAGVTQVYCRPDGENASWHNQGDWNIWTVGRFINELRAKFPKAEPVTA